MSPRDQVTSIILIILCASFQSEPEFLPTSFQNNLISLNLELSDFDTLHLYTDTGGKNFLYKSGRELLELDKSEKDYWENQRLQEVFEVNGAPYPKAKGFTFVNDRKSSFDGMLGREWFSGRVWEFDYQNESLQCIAVANPKDQETLPLAFLKEPNGTNNNHLPRTQIIVDSDTLPMLFDTGAQAHLSLDAQARFHTSELVATSFIQASVFDKWSNDHPEWTVLDNADESFRKPADMIIVPQIQIGSRVIGPVEFTKRDDSNFKVMSNYFMDSTIVGALGGNALHQLNSFVLDYPNERLILNKN